MSRLGFLSKGITTAFLKEVGKQPSENERLARTEMSSEKTPGQDLIREGGIRSAEEDLDGTEVSIL